MPNTSSRKVRLIGPQLTWIMGNLICSCVSRCMDNILYSAFASNSEDVNGLHCNTEKDKIKLHDRSAGMYICT